MVVSRRDFLKLTVSMLGGWVVTIPRPTPAGEIARIVIEMSDPSGQQVFPGVKNTDTQDDEGEYCIPNTSTRVYSESNICNQQKPVIAISDDERVLGEIGYFNDISPEDFVFDENKYSQNRRDVCYGGFHLFGRGRILVLRICP